MTAVTAYKLIDPVLQAFLYYKNFDDDCLKSLEPKYLAYLAVNHDFFQANKNKGSAEFSRITGLPPALIEFAFEHP